MNKTKITGVFNVDKARYLVSSTWNVNKSKYTKNFYCFSLVYERNLDRLASRWPFMHSSSPQSLGLLSRSKFESSK